MDAIGAQELSFPALLPREPYEASGRWTEYGDGIFRLKDRKGNDYLLGPTHEEMFTLAVKDLYSSYKDLPVWLYQIQNKYRDEARPRAGILRGREFVMKDSYSFDTTDEGLDASYAAHREAYVRTFDRLGFDYVIVKATSGAMGGSKSEEFLAKAEVGEDTYVRCTPLRLRRQRRGGAGPPARSRGVRRRARGARRADPRHPDHRHAGRRTSTRSTPATTAPGAAATRSRTSWSCSSTPTAPASRWRSACPATARSTRSGSRASSSRSRSSPWTRPSCAGTPRW